MQPLTIREQVSRPVGSGRKRVLITGANGFVGRHCLASLHDTYHEVHATYFSNHPVAAHGVHWHRADLLDAEDVDRVISEVTPTHLLHMAWVTTPGVYMSSLDNIRWLESSLRILEAFRRNGGVRVVVAGTCFEYDWEYGYCRESLTPLAPSTLYGKCKDALRTALFGLTNECGISSAWGRIFFSYGPDEYPSRLVSSVIRSLLQGKEALCSPGTQIRDFLYVKDVAAAFVALLDGEVEGSVNIASGAPLVLKDMIAAIAEEVGRPDLIRLNAISLRPGEPHLLVADTNRLREEVKFIPQYDLERGIRETVRWWESMANGDRTGSMNRSPNEGEPGKADRSFLPDKLSSHSHL